jgi:hypothetical protein
MMDTRSTPHFRLRRPAKAVAAGVAVLALGTGLAACGGSGNSDSSAPVGGDQTSAAPGQTTDTAGDSAGATTPVAGAAVNAADAAKLMTDSATNFTTAKVTIDADVASAGTLHAEGVEQMKPLALDLTMAVMGQKMEVRMLGTDMYLHLPAAAGMGDKWMKMSLGDLDKLGMGSLSTGLTDPTQMMQKYAKYVQQGTYVGSEQVGGTQTQHYTFTVDAKSALADVAPSGAPSAVTSEIPATMTVDEWLDSQSRPVQAKIDMGKKLGTMTMNWSDFGTKVDVAAPPADQVTDMSSMLTQLGGAGALSSLG